MFHTAMALFLLLTMALALVRVLRGPGRADRMMAAQLLGTTGVAVFLLLAEGMAAPALLDAALVLALLSGLAVVSFVRCGETSGDCHEPVEKWAAAPQDVAPNIDGSERARKSERSAEASLADRRLEQPGMTFSTNRSEEGEPP